MKYIFVLFAVLILGCSFSDNAAFSAQSSSVLRIAYPHFPPFHWKDEQGRMHGLFFDILTEALEKRMQQRLQWTAYPWARCQEQLKNGAEEAIITVPTRERSRYTRTHEHPFFFKPMHLFTATDHPRMQAIMQIRTLADMKGLGLTVITYSQNGWNRDHVQGLGIQSHESPYLENVWMMLAEHRGDLVIEWPRGARPVLQRLGLEEAVIDTGHEIAQMPFHLLIGKGSDHVGLLDPFDRTIEAMIVDGTLARIVRQYD